MDLFMILDGITEIGRECHECGRVDQQFILRTKRNSCQVKAPAERALCLQMVADKIPAIPAVKLKATR